jgi:hypothetical protein
MKAGRVMDFVDKEMSEQARKTIVGTVLFVIVMVGMALRLWRLDAGDLGTDEIITAFMALQDVGSILQFHLEKAGNPPLLSLMTRLFFINLGHSEFVARLPAALFGTLSVLLAYKLGEILWTRQVGMIGAFLLAVNAYHVWLSQIARYYTLMAFLALLSVILLIKALQKNSKLLWIGFIICTVLSLYNHYFSLLFLPAEVAFGAWVVARNWLSHARKGNHALPGDSPDPMTTPARQSVPFFLSLAVIGLLYLPWVPRLVESSRPAVGSGAPVLSVASVQISLKFVQEVLVAFSATDGVALLVSVCLLLVGLVNTRRERLLLVLLWMGMPFIFLAVVGPGHFLRPKYVLFALPVYLLTLAKGITSIALWVDVLFKRLTIARVWPAALVMGLTAVVLGGLNIPSLQSHYREQKEDWSIAVEYLTDRIASTDVVIADGEGYHGRKTERPMQALTYYLSLTRHDVTILGPPERVLDAIPHLSDIQPRVWGVFHHSERLDNLDRARETADIVQLPDVAVISVPTSAGNWAEHAIAVLRAMLELQTSDQGRFEYHLVLAHMYAQSNDSSQAASHLALARLTMPANKKASSYVAEATALLGTLPDPQFKPVSFGDSLLLSGHRVQPTTISGDEPIRVVLRLQATGDIDKDYTLFIHLVDAGGHVWAQDDRLLEHEGLLTSAWEPAQVVTARYELTIPNDAPPGAYTIQAGIYYWETRQRLAVWYDNGERLPGDTILLDEVVVSG